MDNWHARRALYWWRGLVEARALIGRVLLRAHDSWEASACSIQAYSTQFQELHQVCSPDESKAHKVLHCLGTLDSAVAPS